MKEFCLYWLPVILLAVAIFIQSSLPAPKLLPHVYMSDKLLHVIVYGILAALCYRALQRASAMKNQPVWLLILTAILITSLYGLSDEWHQSFVISRRADIFDLLADIIGSISGAITYAILISACPLLNGNGGFRFFSFFLPGIFDA
jgi:VanZ family protein